VILMLEDSADRLARFAAVMQTVAPGVPFRTWRSAWVMVREVCAFLPAARLISLDHDLAAEEGDEDPGDGLDVVRFLVQQRQPCPVIIHSSNRQRSDWMAGEMELAGWVYHRVAPLGDDWIEEHWRHVARRLLRRRRRRR
jgi:hypothetical protein